MTNDFLNSPQYASGDKAAQFLDSYFQKLGWQLEKTNESDISERELHRGDRIFRRNNIERFIEYKGGEQTLYTGNVFLETVSVDVNNTPGWVYTSEADLLFYLVARYGSGSANRRTRNILFGEMILAFKPPALRASIEALKQRFDTVSTNTQNSGYKTCGLKFPVDYTAKNLACKVLPLAFDAFDDDLLEWELD